MLIEFRSVSAAPIYEPIRTVDEHHNSNKYAYNPGGQSTGEVLNSFRSRPDYISDHPHNLFVDDRFNDYHSPGPSSNRHMAANISKSLFNYSFKA
jgi:hypothetical protein